MLRNKYFWIATVAALVTAVVGAFQIVRSRYAFLEEIKKRTATSDCERLIVLAVRDTPIEQDVAAAISRALPKNTDYQQLCMDRGVVAIGANPDISEWKDTATTSSGTDMIYVLFDDGSLWRSRRGDRPIQIEHTSNLPPPGWKMIRLNGK